MLKALFVLEIFTFLSYVEKQLEKQIFGSVEKRLDMKTKVILKIYSVID